MKKRVAIVVPNLVGSGGEKIALTQAKIFFENGNDVVLFLLEDLKTYDINDIKFPIIPLTNKKDKYKILGKLGYKIYAKILESTMKEFGKFDLVISNLPRADRTVKELNHHNKYFVIHTSYSQEILNLNKTKKYRRAIKKDKLYRYLYSNENIITISNEMQNYFADGRIKTNSVKTIYNPFDFDEIRNKSIENIDINYDYIISPSAFRTEKRYDILLQAFKLVRNDIKLLILSNNRNELFKLVKKYSLEDKVIILDFQDNPYKYMKNAKLLVLSSEREGLPTVVIESLILGTPVVSTDCPTGPKEILLSELSRWLVPVNDHNNLALRIDKALESNIVIDEKIIDKFNKSNIYKQYSKLF